MGYARRRLPSLAEWTLAAFGPKPSRRYPWGEAEPTPRHLNACFGECARGVRPVRGAAAPRPLLGLTDDDGAPTTAPIGHYALGSTPEGLRDMGGNVWEWTSTEREQGRRAIVGGGWYESEVELLRRGGAATLGVSVRFPTLGFRCAR